MLNPVFHTDSRRVPILSKAAIDALGERLIAEYCPSAMRTPREIDIDDFAQNYLGLRQDFQYLSHCGVYLGMTVFNDTDHVIVFDPDTARAEYISAKAGTIIIDSSLLEPSKEHRYRYTMGHESGHGICHKGFYENVRSNMTDNAPLVRCRIDQAAVKKKPASQWTSEDWMEWQANRLSSAILMPRAMVREVARSVEDELPELHDIAAIATVSQVFNVSNEAAQYRLLDLNLITSRVPVSVLLDFGVI